MTAPGSVSPTYPRWSSSRRRSRKNSEELIAAGLARGFLHKSVLSVRAIKDVLDGGTVTAPTPRRT
ncbi:hypothetical protein [Streptomyces sp. NPDC001315]|uniref:hypothetical protein n=1 Tax=Streptomyces sp. NPDC001315 TaxID=3364562 RepID=UPI0036964A52